MPPTPLMIFRDTLNPEESSANIPQGLDPAPPIIIERKREKETDRQTDRQTDSQTEGERGVGVIMTILINTKSLNEMNIFQCFLYILYLQ